MLLDFVPFLGLVPVSRFVQRRVQLIGYLHRIASKIWNFAGWHSKLCISAFGVLSAFVEKFSYFDVHFFQCYIFSVYFCDCTVIVFHKYSVVSLESYAYVISTSCFKWLCGVISHKYWVVYFDVPWSEVLSFQFVSISCCS